jgi:hypothetical protein
MRSALFWGITQSRVVILYQRFRTTYRSHLQGSRSPRRGTDTLSRNVDKGLPLNAALYPSRAQISDARHIEKPWLDGWTNTLGLCRKNIPDITDHHLCAVVLEALQHPRLYAPLPVLQRSVAETNPPQSGESINRLAFHTVLFIRTVQAVHLKCASTQNIMHPIRLADCDWNSRFRPWRHNNVLWQ